MVRAPFGTQRHAYVHEADIAAVIAAALRADGHAGKTYMTTGPEALSRAELVRPLADAIGKPIEFAELTQEEGRAQLREAGFTEEIVDAVISYGANPPPEAHTVLPTVEQVTGRPPRSFGEWTAEHAALFRG